MKIRITVSGRLGRSRMSKLFTRSKETGNVDRILEILVYHRVILIYLKLMLTRILAE